METIERMIKIASEWEQTKEVIYPILLPKEKKVRIDGLVKREWLDLTVCYLIRLPQCGCCHAGIRVTDNLLKTWGINEEELHSRALKNLRGDHYRTKSLLNMLWDILTDEDMAPKDQDEDMALILTNEQGYYGAAVMLDSELLRKIAGNQDMYILPSSIHELILIPVEKYMNKNELDILVQEVNRECVLPKEKLSDHAYYYNHKKRRIEL